MRPASCHRAHDGGVWRAFAAGERRTDLQRRLRRTAVQQELRAPRPRRMRDRGVTIEERRRVREPGVEIRRSRPGADVEIER